MLDSDHRLTYWRKGLQIQNFGDLLTEFLFARLSSPSPLPWRDRWRRSFDVVHLIGSVISDVAIARDLEHCRWSIEPRIAFWGCGLRQNRPIRRELLDHCLFYGIRGPLSRRALSLRGDMPVGDPGLLLPLIHNPRPAPDCADRVVCIPHFLDTKSDTELLSLTEAEIVLRPNIAASMEAMMSMIDSIAAARFLLCGALHGAITAVAYDRPFAFFDSGYIDVPFKWQDFAASVGIESRFVTTVSDGLAQYEKDRLRIQKPSLTDVLSSAPFWVSDAQMTKALAHDRSFGTFPSRPIADRGRAWSVEKIKSYLSFRREPSISQYEASNKEIINSVVYEDDDIVVFKRRRSSGRSIMLFFDSVESEKFDPAAGSDAEIFGEHSKYIFVVKKMNADLAAMANAVWHSLEAEIDPSSTTIALGHGAGAALALRLAARLKAEIVVAISPSQIDRSPPESSSELGARQIYLIYDPKDARIHDVIQSNDEADRLIVVPTRNGGPHLLDIFPDHHAVADLLTACVSSRPIDVHSLAARYRRAFAKRALAIATAAQARHPETTLRIIEAHGQSLSRRETATLYASAGERLFKTGRRAEAAHCFSSATELFPDDANYSFMRSVFLFHTHKTDEALAWARRASSLAPNHDHIARHLDEVERRASARDA